MFLLNSCLNLFSAALSPELPFSRSYGDILPSSLTMLLPPALGSSPCLPVSVCGTGPYGTIVAFPGSSSASFPTLFRSFTGCPPPCILTHGRHPAPPVFPFPAEAYSLRPHISDHPELRILNLMSITYASPPRLRSRLPQGRSALPWKPLAFGLKDSYLHLATHSGILSSCRSTARLRTASLLHQCSPTDLIHPQVHQIPWLR